MRQQHEPDAATLLRFTGQHPGDDDLFKNAASDPSNRNQRLFEAVRAERAKGWPPA